MKKTIYEIEVKQPDQKVCKIPPIKLVNPDDAKNINVEMGNIEKKTQFELYDMPYYVPIIFPSIKEVKKRRFDE